MYSAAQKKVLGLLHVILQVFIDNFKKIHDRTKVSKNEAYAAKHNYDGQTVWK